MELGFKCITVLFSLNICLGSCSIYKSLKQFSTLHSSELQHHIVKRGLQESSHPFNKIREVRFTTLGRDFRLILTPRKGLLHSQFEACTVDGHGKERPVIIDHGNFYEGRMFGEKWSHASVHLEDGVITAKIDLPQETYHIEPSWRHLPELGSEYMVTYRESDVRLSWHALNHTPCAYAKEGPYWNETVDYEEEKQSNPVKDYTSIERRKRSANYIYTPAKSQCSLVLVADYKFYQEMGGRSSKKTINYLISLIDRVNKIYNDTVWGSQEETEGFTGMGFVIKKIVVHSEPTKVLKGNLHYNMFREKWDVNLLLEVFSRETSGKDFCLSHLFTHQTFYTLTEPMPTLGLAYIASPKHLHGGGICPDEYFKNGHTMLLNSGLSTSKNYFGERLFTLEADLVTAHEFGHNWGSHHDPATPECTPTTSQGGSYLMYMYSITGYEVNNKKFSPCTRRSVGEVLKAKAPRCFSQPEKSFCGNLYVEGDEECDAGLLGTGDNDTCCDKFCKLRRNEGAVCSDKNSPCCQNCQFMVSGTKCREAQYATCEEASYCSGTSSDCPKSAPMADGTECLERGKCRLGKCIPYCETQGLQCCMCDTPEENSCKRCCRISLNTSCIPVTPQQILPDGTPCIRGYCKQGVCKMAVQDAVERFWNVIEHITINKMLLMLRDNLVLAVILLTSAVWVPASCVINYFDRSRSRRKPRRIKIRTKYQDPWNRSTELLLAGDLPSRSNRNKASCI